MNVEILKTTVFVGCVTFLLLFAFSAESRDLWGDINDPGTSIRGYSLPAYQEPAWDNTWTAPRSRQSIVRPRLGGGYMEYFDDGRVNQAIPRRNGGYLIIRD